MEEANKNTLQSIFEGLNDPRVERTKLHNLLDSMMISILGVLGGAAGVIAIDGKTLRRSHDAANGKKALHMVSAWADANRMVLAQVAVEEKSNEITVIPALLKLLDLHGCLVTIDAMETQRAILA